GNSPNAGAVSGSGLWTQISGPSTAGIVDPSSPNSVVNNLVAGTYIFRWTISSAGGCQDYDDITIRVNSLIFTAPDINVDGLVDGRIVINIPVPPGGSVEITKQPSNGT